MVLGTPDYFDKDFTAAYSIVIQPWHQAAVQTGYGAHHFRCWASDQQNSAPGKDDHSISETIKSKNYEKYVCSSCGVQLVTGEASIIANCVYCGS